MSEREIVCEDLNLALDDLKSQGYRLDVIYPADGPHSALLSRHGHKLWVTSNPGAQRPSAELPPFVPEFVLTNAGADAGEGRAGMLYRDLIPGRLGGRYIASHIAIPEGGPVSDWVHYHHVRFQVIAVRRGWVRVVYEDQGDPFVMDAGDLVLQPPTIRHRVLESSPGFEVVEVSCPALHETYADHLLELPNGRVEPGRLFAGQRFVHQVAATTRWRPFNGGEARDMGVGLATAGVAEVRTLRPAEGSDIVFPPHDGELVFGFVLDGSARLSFEGEHDLGPGDAFVIPPREPWSLSRASEDFRLLHVTTSQVED